MRKLLSVLLVLTMLLSVPALAADEAVSAADMYASVLDSIAATDWKYTSYDSDNYLSLSVSLDDTSFAPEGCLVYVYGKDGSVRIQCDYDLTIPSGYESEIQTLFSLIAKDYYYGKFYTNADGSTIGCDIVLLTYDATPTAASLKYAISVGINMLNDLSPAFNAVINEGKPAAEAYSLIQ